MDSNDYIADAERTRIVLDVESQLQEIVRLHFPRTGNLEYALLKSHLIVEHAITEFVRCTSFVLVPPEQLRFSFAEKLEVAMLHGFGNGCPRTVPSVQLLNRIRNQVAHRLSFDVDLVNELIQINTEDGDACSFTARQRIAFLRWWCHGICGQIVGHLFGLVEVTKRTALTRVD